MAGKTFCSKCGLLHHPMGCKVENSQKNTRRKTIDALNILSITTPKK